MTHTPSQSKSKPELRGRRGLIWTLASTQERKLQLKLEAQLEKTVVRIPGAAMLYKKVMELQSYLGRPKAALTPSGLTESQVQKRVSLSARNWNALSLAQKDELS